MGEDRGDEGPGGGGRGAFNEKWVGGGGQMGGGWGKKSEFWVGVPEKKKNKEKKGVGVVRKNLGRGRGVEPRG